MSLSLFIYVSLSFSPSLSLFLYLSTLYLYMPVSQSVCLSVSVSLSLCLSVSLSECEVPVLARHSRLIQLRNSKVAFVGATRRQGQRRCDPALATVASEADRTGGRGDSNTPLFQNESVYRIGLHLTS